MDDYKHVLFATDLAPEGGRAAQRAARLANCCDARLSLLHVIDYFPEDVPVGLIPPENEDPAQFLMAHARAALAQLAAELDHPDIESQVAFCSHSAAYEIAHFAKAEAVDLVVVASHGRHALWETLGSTSGSISHHLCCDMVIVHGG